MGQVNTFFQMRFDNEAQATKAMRALNERQVCVSKGGNPETIGFDDERAVSIIRRMIERGWIKGDAVVTEHP